MFARILGVLVRSLLAVGALVWLGASPASALDDAPREARAADISVADLPHQARVTIELIRAGGPFPHARDGALFGNYEKRLPIRPRGYYREYTVRTPGSKSRGARRIVAGRGGELYYTDDHYRTFRRVRDGNVNGKSR